MTYNRLLTFVVFIVLTLSLVKGQEEIEEEILVDYQWPPVERLRWLYGFNVNFGIGYLLF